MVACLTPAIPAALRRRLHVPLRARGSVAAAGPCHADTTSRRGGAAPAAGWAGHGDDDGDNYHGVKNFTKEQITYTIEELIEEELMQGITLGFKERMRFAEGNDEGGK